MLISVKSSFFYITMLSGIFLHAKIHSQDSDNEVINTVDHKNLQLSLYLDLIKYNTQEKLGILPYIHRNPSGTYLEVGTGGDPIADLLSKVPKESRPTIIASDIDENVLSALPQRHPQLKSYMNNTNGPRFC